MATVKAKPAEPEVNEYGEKLVTIRLPLTRDNTKGEYVRVNQREWIIPRGKEWKVPECVAEALEHSEEQELERMEYENKVRKG